MGRKVHKNSSRTKLNWGLAVSSAGKIKVKCFEWNIIGKKWKRLREDEIFQNNLIARRPTKKIG